ncbi:hypothetical protein PAUR_a2197 [Pseudoalteromonas aurantia 208]|uniref:Uncharacterized protein n=1 Tax=Pseudoalteromonas aurantia 208 TaxID=1314867 RepID=A0ABR9EDW8_9GAMM|nr:hypothetical protein [Pseudoalteromonas aurantia 208]
MFDMLEISIYVILSLKNNAVIFIYTDLLGVVVKTQGGVF